MTRKLWIVGAVLVTVIIFGRQAKPNMFIPDFGYSHNAFVCNHLGTVCRDKASVLPVVWQRYTP